MGYPICPPPYYSTFTTITSPSSNPYTPFASFPNPYDYYGKPPPPPSSPPLPYSQPQPPPPYSPTSCFSHEWSEHTSATGRRSFYYNKRTKLSSWEKPFELMTPIERVDASTNWKEFTSPDGRKYYYNKITKESKWLIPEELKLAREQVKKAGGLAAPVTNSMAETTLNIVSVVAQPANLSTPMLPPAVQPKPGPTLTTTAIKPSVSGTNSHQPSSKISLVSFCVDDLGQITSPPKPQVPIEQIDTKTTTPQESWANHKSTEDHMKPTNPSFQKADSTMAPPPPPAPPDPKSTPSDSTFHKSPSFDSPQTEIIGTGSPHPSLSFPCLAQPASKCVFSGTPLDSFTGSVAAFVTPLPERYYKNYGFNSCDNPTTEPTINTNPYDPDPLTLQPQNRVSAPPLPSPPPKPPDLSYQQANSTKLPPPSESIPLNDLSSQQSPSSFTGVAFTKTKCHRNIPIVQSAEYQVSSHPLDQQRPRNGPSLPFISQQSQYPFLVPSASTTVSIQNSLARLSPSDRHLVSADISQPSTNSTIRVLLSHWPSASHVSSFNSRTEMPPSSLQHRGSQLLPQNQNPMSHLTTKPAVFENCVPLLKIPAGQHVIPVWPPHTTDFYRANFACYEAGNLFPVGFTNVISACLAFLTMLPSVKQKEELIGYEVHAIPIREFKQWGECTVVTRIIPGAITFSPILYGYLNFNIGPPHKTLWNIEGTISTITADLIQLTRQQDMMVFLERLKKKKKLWANFFFLQP